MADVFRPEMAVRAVVKEADPGSAAVKDVVTSVRKTLEEKGAEAAAKSLALRQPDTTVSRHIINENIGLDRDPATGKKVLAPGSDQEKRANRAKAEDLKLTDYQTKEYDKLTPTQQAEISNQILDRLNQTPAWNAVISGMNPTKKAEFVKRIATDNSYRDEVLKGYTEAFNTELTDLVTAVGAEVKTLQEQVDKLVGIAGPPAVKGELTTVDERIRTIKDEINEYQVEVKDGSAPGGKRPGKNYERMTKALTEIGITTNEVQTAQIDVEVKQIEVERLSKEKPGGARTHADILADLTRAKGELSTLSATWINKQTELKQKTDLYEKVKTGEAELKTELVQKEAEFDELDTSRLSLESQLSVKKMEFAKGTAKRAHEEELFVKKIEAIIGNAADSWMEDQIATAVEDVKIKLTTKAGEAEAAGITAFGEVLAGEYFTGNKVNVARVRQDYEILLNSGPDNLTVTMMARSGLSPKEIKDIQKDPVKFATYRDKVTENVLKMYMLRGGLLKSGGRMSPDEVVKISTSEWGQGMIESALKGKSELVATINKASGDQILSADGKLSERFRKRPVRNIMMILLALVGLMGGGIFGAGKI